MRKASYVTLNISLRDHIFSTILILKVGLDYPVDHAREEKKRRNFTFKTKEFF